MVSSMNGLIESYNDTLNQPKYSFLPSQTCNCSITKSRFFLNSDFIVSFVFGRHFYNNDSKFSLSLVPPAFLYRRQEKNINDLSSGTAGS